MTTRSRHTRGSGSLQLAAGCALFATVACSGTSKSTEPPEKAIGGAPAIQIAANAGEVIASADLIPAAGALLEGTTSDGTRYTLKIEPDSVPTPITVEMRPLSGGTEGGTLIAGIDFSPAGTVLLRPAQLDIYPPKRSGGLIAAVKYSGAPTSAAGALTPVSVDERGVLHLRVAHFSGVAVLVLKQATYDQIYQQAMAAREDTSPTGKQAMAEAKYALAEMKLREAKAAGDAAGVVAAQEMMGRFEAEWNKANVERVMQIKDLTKVQDVYNAISGTLLDLKNDADNESKKEAVREVTALLGKYMDSVVDALQADQAVQARIESGKVSDYDTNVALAQSLLGLARTEALLSGDAKVSKAAEMAKYVVTRSVDAIGKNCEKNPISQQDLYRLSREGQLFGGDEFALEKCVPPPREITGAITWTAANGDESGQGTFNLKLQAADDEGFQLKFVRGSTYSWQWRYSGPVDTHCPRSRTFTGAIGSYAPTGGLDKASDPKSDVFGVVVDQATSLMIGIHLGVSDPKGCSVSGFRMNCNFQLTTGDMITANRITTRPNVYQVACKAREGGMSYSASGTLKDNR